MIRHDLQLVQPCSRVVFRDGVPAVQNDQARIVKFHTGIRPISNDASEDVATAIGADRHEIGATRVVVVP